MRSISNIVLIITFLSTYAIVLATNQTKSGKCLFYKMFQAFKTSTFSLINYFRKYIFVEEVHILLWLSVKTEGPSKILRDINFFNLGLKYLCTYIVHTKEVCNRGVACSLLKLGSLERTVIASLFHSGLHSDTIFLWKKPCHMSY